MSNTANDKEIHSCIYTTCILPKTEAQSHGLMNTSKKCKKKEKKLTQT